MGVEGGPGRRRAACQRAKVGQGQGAQRPACTGQAGWVNSGGCGEQLAASPARPGKDILARPVKWVCKEKCHIEGFRSFWCVL